MNSRIISTGDTVDEDFDNARNAIEVHCKMLAESKTGLPVATPTSHWQKSKKLKGWTWGIVDADV